MNVRAIQFGGICQGGCCESDNDDIVRGAVEVSLCEYDDDMGEMICLKCAASLQRQLKAAIERVKSMQRKGRIYRDDMWVKAARPDPRGETRKGESENE